MTDLAQYNGHLKQYLEVSGRRQAEEIGLFVAEMIKQSGDVINARIDNLTDVDIAEIQDFVTTLKGLLDADEGTEEFDVATNIITRLGAIETAIAGNDTDISALQSAVGALQTEAARIESDLTAALAAQKTDLEAQIAAVDAKTTANSDALAAEIARAQGAEAANASAISAEVARAQAAEATLTGRADAADAAIATNAAAIATNAGDIATLQTQTATNSGAIADAVSAAAAEKSRVNTALDGKVDKTEVLAAWDNMDPAIVNFADGLRVGFAAYVPA